MEKNSLKWILIILLILGIGLGSGYMLTKGNNKKEKSTNNSVKLKELPKPEISEGQRGELGIDKNINEKNIDEYLGREDSVYRDMRMLEDPAKYESIGGDRYLSGYIKGFEIVPLPYLIPVTGLPDAVGDTYKGKTLFSIEDDKFVANYKESMSIIEELFPKDKVIFLMCGGGGYAGMTKNFLVQLGWDENKIYNVGGFWYYEGKNKVEVKKVVDGKTIYDFDSVPYHNIDFDKLTVINEKVNNISVTSIKINTTKKSIVEGQSFQLNAIVLPNEVTNKKVVWTSSNTNAATVDQKGLVSAKTPGTTTIKVTTDDGKKEVTCVITVSKSEKSNTIKLSDVTNEYNKFKKTDLENIDKKYGYLEDMNNPKILEKYYTYNGEGYAANDLWKAEYAKMEKEKNAALKTRKNILNSLIINKKNFIVLLDSGNCQSLPYSPMLGAQKILKSKGIPYFLFYTRREDTYSKSKIHFNDFRFGAVIIVKEGKIYKYINSDKDSFKSDKEVLNWLKKYIVIK